MTMVCAAHTLQLPFLSSTLDFEVPESKFIAVLGPNGSGKTTLLRTLIGEQKPIAGRLDLLGQNSIELRPADLSTLVSYVPQEHEYPLNLHVVDLLRYAFLPQKGWFDRLPDADDPRIAHVVTQFRLEGLSDRPLFRLSTGERQRAFLARACLQEPRVLILDEPTNHLDPGGVSAFWNVLKTIQVAQRLSVLMSTHELQMVQTHCDWVLAIKPDGVLFNGPSETFFEKNLPQTLYGL